LWLTKTDIISLLAPVSTHKGYPSRLSTRNSL
jgi:hypothetical protein